MIVIPDDFIDRCSQREKNHYRDPIYSREAIVDIIQLNNKKVNFFDIKELYKDHEEKQKALDYRVKAMIRDGQLIEIDDQITTLTYWPLVQGTYVQTARQEHVILTEPQGSFSPVASLDGHLFNGDYAYFSWIEPLQQVAFYDFIEQAPVFLKGEVQDPDEYEMPSGYPIALKVNQGPYHNQVISCRLGDKKNITPGSKVAARLLRENEEPFVLAEIIDTATVPAGIYSMIQQYNLSWVWNADVLKETSQFHEDDIVVSQGRRDLTECPFVTIDGISSKDFDDAVYAQPIEDKEGHWRLYVAIADVAFYVKPGTALDREASRRGCSVYFPQYVIPMLPEELSNELCSLKPEVLRNVLACSMDINPQGDVECFEFFPAVINSHARLTYDQVQRRDIDPSLKGVVSGLWSVYELLAAARQRQGYVNFAHQSVHFDIVDPERVVGITRGEGMESYKLIEEMMLAANQCAARLIQKSCEHGVYRVHGEPTEPKVQLLNASLKPLGLRLKAPYTLGKIRNLSKQLQEQYPRLSSCVARIMQRACYQTVPESHFGLNFELYTHFTSPIRRYPDLLVHRLIYAIIGKKDFRPIYKNLKTALDRVNYLERRAEEADRQYQAYLKARFAEELEGQIFDAIVTGLSEHGFFVELDDYPLEGMVHFSQIDGSYWQYLPEEGKVVSNDEGQFVIGDALTVQLAEVDLAQSRLNFSVVRDS